LSGPSPSRALIADLVATSVSFRAPRTSDGRWPLSRGERSLRESIWNILLTRPGERILRPEFGAGIGRFIHQPNDETTRALVADAVSRAVERWEPRVQLERVEVVREANRPTELAVSVHYRMRHGAEAGVVEVRVGDSIDGGDAASDGDTLSERG
jgi:phage baseplate assembly protein W